MMTSEALLTIKFIEAVEKEPCIWNYSLDEHNKRDVIAKAWENVSKECNESVETCRKRWRNIRNTFLRSLKLATNDSGSKKKKKDYYLSSHLKFLNSYTKNNNSDENLSILVLDEETNDKVEMLFMPLNDDAKEDFLSEPETSSSQSMNLFDHQQSTENLPSSSTSSLCRKKEPLRQHSESAADTALMKWLQNKDKLNDTEDANLLFLKSLLPDIRQMTDVQNRRFRKKVLGLIDDILEDKDLVEITPSVQLGSWNPLPNNGRWHTETSTQTFAYDQYKTE